MKRYAAEKIVHKRAVLPNPTASERVNPNGYLACLEAEDDGKGQTNRTLLRIIIVSKLCSKITIQQHFYKS